MNEQELIKKFVPKDKQTEALDKLVAGYPVQYIIGNVDFYDCDIKVNENVLIPRFETELLVDKTIALLKSKFNKKISIADLGTGSGAIAIALKKNVDSLVTGFDISDKAIEVAKENALLNNVEIELINHDIHNKIPGKYDCIISNPPYLLKGSEVADPVKYEPELALYASDDGLEYYYKILDYAEEVLNEEYLIAFEIGLNQSDRIMDYAKKKLSNANVWAENDLTGQIRYIFITNE